LEVEIKLNVKPAIAGGPIMLFTRLTMVAALGGTPLGDIGKHEIHDLYYDTPDGKLAAAGAGLRSRLLDGVPHITLKISQYRDGSLTAREEYEEQLTRDRFDWVMAQAAHLVGEGPFSMEEFSAGRPCGGGLEPIITIDTARLVRPIGQVAELTMDMIEYPGLAPAPFFDIEIEAKSGKAGERVIRAVEADLYDLAEGFVGPASMSKLERGLKLKEKTGAK
jgi:inorganic triphosphatase YgiF